MKHRCPGRAARGFTLIEMLMTITVLSIVSVGVSLLYSQALRLYARGQREATSRDKAALAIEKIMPEIREAYNVDYPGPHLILFTLPERGTDGQYLINATTKALVNGKQVAIYQAGPSGVYGTEGRYIWRSERPYGASAWTKTGVIMDDVEDISFTYAPSIEMLELVQAAITVGQGTYPSYFNRTEIAEVYIRNH